MQGPRASANPPGDEAQWLAWVCRSAASGPSDPDLVLGPGDDAAIWRSPSGDSLLLAVDTIVEGIHFALEVASPEAVGRKAMNANLSDIAAMAGRPRAALVSLATPPGFGTARLRQVMAGLRGAAERFGVSVAGGDLSRSPAGLHVTVTVVGDTGPSDSTSGSRAIRPVLRSGAKPGDVLVVTGPLGGSYEGHHLDFVPRVEEASILARRYDLHAMMDLSDGLGIDLHRLCRASGVGALIDESALPVSPEATMLAARSGRSTTDHVLRDGEDFELVIAMSAADAEDAARSEAPCRVFPIGKVTDREGILELRCLDGQVRPLEPIGHEHRIDSDDH